MELLQKCRELGAEISDNYIRFDYWKPAPQEIISLLKEHGYKERYEDDDDCGKLYYYQKEN